MKNDDEILFDKELRERIAIVIDLLRAARTKSAERTLAFRALQSARHWLGEDLAVLGAQHPYPNGNNPDNAIVDPPADVANRRTGTPCSCEVYQVCMQCNPEEYRKEVARRNNEGQVGNSGGIGCPGEKQFHHE